MKAWVQHAPPKRSIAGKNVTVAAVLDIPKAAVRGPPQRLLGFRV